MVNNQNGPYTSSSSPLSGIRCHKCPKSTPTQASTHSLFTFGRKEELWFFFARVSTAGACFAKQWTGASRVAETRHFPFPFLLHADSLTTKSDGQQTQAGPILPSLPLLMDLMALMDPRSTQAPKSAEASCPSGREVDAVVFLARVSPQGADPSSMDLWQGSEAERPGTPLLSFSC
jgi:hypothetical protein